MKKIRLIIDLLPKPLRNKYIITILIFILWILFFDDYNLLKQRKIQKQVDELEKQKHFYSSEQIKDSTELYHLNNNKEKQEKFAREKFLMKKEKEDVFIIRNKNE